MSKRNTNKGQQVPWHTKLAGLVAARAIKSWLATLDYRVAFYDAAVDPAGPGCSDPQIFVFWHEGLMAPIHMRGHCNLAMLISQHRDAEILGRVALHLGFKTVRGSSTRGGIAALMEMMKLGRTTHLTITPDGPRGPRRQMAPGAVYLASRTGMPIVCLGIGYDRPWRANSWDRLAIPRPFSRCRGVIGPALHLPRDLDPDGVEHYRFEVERMLNRLTLEAESWASSGTTKIEEQPIRPDHLFRQKPGGEKILARPDETGCSVPREKVRHANAA